MTHQTEIIPLGVSAVASGGNTTSFLANHDSLVLMLDTGTNPLPALSMEQVWSVSDLFISHSHADHTSGFAAFVFVRSVVAARAVGRTPAPLRVWCNVECVALLEVMVRGMYPDREIPLDFRPVEAGEVVRVSDSSTLRFVAADHTVPALSCRFDCECGFSLVFTGDTRLSSQVISLCEDVDVLLGESFGLEADFGEVASQQGHMTAEDLARLIQLARPRLAVPFHMHLPYIFQPNESRRMREMLGGNSTEVVWPDPGQTIIYRP